LLSRAFLRYNNTDEKLRSGSPAISRGEFEFTRHAFKRAVERDISSAEIIEAVANAQMIEDYPEDKYAPSCLIFGITKAGRQLHLQVSYVDSDLVKIITLYEPDPSEWINGLKRR